MAEKKADFSWLWDSDPTENEMKAPEGGFGPQGFLGQWTCSPMYRTWLPEGVTPEIFNEATDLTVKLNNGSFNYWRWDHFDQGVALARAVGGDDASQVRRNTPRPIMRWEMPTALWLNVANEEARQAWGELITFDIPIQSLQYQGRLQHEYQALFLPSLVQEMALVNGLIDERLYDYTDLISDPNLVTDAYYLQMVGGKEFKDSELWRARTEIWAALGEENPTAYTWQQGGKFDAESKLLKQILTITTANEERKTTTFWANMVKVADPMPPAEDKKAYDKYVVAAIFTTKEGAEASHEGVDAGTYPPVPAGWDSSSVDEWKTWAKNHLAENFSGLPDAVIQDKLKETEGLFKAFAVEGDEFAAWVPYLK